jgi:hypothetical protein
MTGGSLQYAYTFETPADLATAVASGAGNETLASAFQTVCARATAIVALTYLKDEGEAARQNNAYMGMKTALEERDDAARESMTQPAIRPDTGVGEANYVQPYSL